MVLIKQKRWLQTALHYRSSVDELSAQLLQTEQARDRIESNKKSISRYAWIVY